MSCEDQSQAPLEQDLEHFEKELLGDSAPPEFDAPLESPTLKRLREEDELKQKGSSRSVTASQQVQASGVRHFIRPQSNGNDDTGYQFRKAPTSSNRAAAEPIKASQLTFAPIGFPMQNQALHKQKRSSTEPPGAAAVQEAEVRETIEADPQQCTSVLVTEASTLPEHSSYVDPHHATSASPRPIVTISSDPTNDTSAREESSNSLLETATHGDSGIEIKNPRRSDATDPAAIPVPGEPPLANLHNGTPPAINDDEEHPNEESRPNPSHGGPARSQSHRPKISRRPSPVLSINGERPMRVSKGSRRPTAGRHTQSLPFVPAEQQTISDEDILMVLIHRRKQMETNLSDAHAKVRTLQSRNDALAKQNIQLDDEIQQLSIQYDETVGKQGQLTEALKVFKAKYYRLKEFAKGINAGIMELRHVKTAHASSIEKLADETRDNLNASEAANAAFQRVGDELNKYKKSLAEARHDQAHLAGLLAPLKQQLADRDEQLVEEKRRCRRLENHVTELSGTQQRQNKSFTADLNALKTSLAKISREVLGVDTSVTAVDTDLIESTGIIKAVQQQLQEGPQLSSGEATMLAALQPQIKEVRDSLIKAVEKSGCGSQASSLSSMVASIAGIHTSVQALAPTSEAFNDLELRNAKLESDVRNLKDERDHLRSSVNKAQKTTDTSVTALVGLSQRPPDRMSDKNAHVDLIRKCEFASSSLKSVTKELEVSQEEKARLEEQLSKCHEEAKQQKIDHQRHQEKLASQHTENLAAQRRNFQATIDNVRSQVDQLEQANKVNREKVVNLNAESSQYEQALSDLRGKHDKASSEVKQLRSQIVGLSKSLKASEAQIEILRAKEAELDSLKPQAKDDADEVQRLTQFESACTRLNSEVEGLKKTLAAQVSEAALQDVTLKKAEADARQLPGLQQTINELEVARGDLVKKLEQAEALARTIPQIRRQLESAQQAKSDMDAELQRLRPLEGQLSSATEEKDTVAQELVQTKELLAQARQQIDANAGLLTQLRMKDQRIAELQQQASAAARLQADYLMLRAESQKRDSLLTALQEQIEKSQQAAERAYAEEETQDLRPIPFDEGQLSGPLAEQLTNSQDLPEDLPRRNSSASFKVPSQRKVADRSAKNQIQRAMSTQTKREIAETQQSGQAASKIPDSVPNTQPTEEEDPGDSDNDSESPLSEIDAAAKDWPDREATDDTTRKAVRLRLRPPRVPQEETMARPSSSSAMSEDLFSKHVSGVDQASQMHGHPMSPPQRTVDPSDLVRHRETTPDVQRARVQPNSAMKRRNQDISQPPAGKKQKQSQDSGDEMPAPPSSAARSRSSIVGSNGPMPGTSQRRGRPARKSSRTDRYNSRFGSS